MLSNRDLSQLASTYRDQRVLTIYLHTTAENPADRRAWQAELDNALQAVRARAAGADRDERAAVEGTLERVREWISGRTQPSGGANLLLVVSPAGVVHEASLSADVPVAASWGAGVHLAPLLRGVGRGERATVLLLDARHAHLFRLDVPRRLERLQSFTAQGEGEGGGGEGDRDSGIDRRMGAVTGGMHPGTRGVTGTDEAERQRLAARQRLYAEALQRAAEVMGREEWLVLAGATRSVAAARALVPTALSARTVEMDHVDVHASEAVLAESVSAEIALRERARDLATVRELLEAYGARGRGAAGIEATRAVLERESVAELLLSETFAQRHPDETDELLRAAIAQGATVRAVGGDAGAESDSQAGGVLARLRYALVPGDGAAHA